MSVASQATHVGALVVGVASCAPHMPFRPPPGAVEQLLLSSACRPARCWECLTPHTSTERTFIQGFAISRVCCRPLCGTLHKCSGWRKGVTYTSSGPRLVLRPCPDVCAWVHGHGGTGSFSPLLHTPTCAPPLHTHAGTKHGPSNPAPHPTDSPQRARGTDTGAHVYLLRCLLAWCSRACAYGCGQLFPAMKLASPPMHNHRACAWSLGVADAEQDGCFHACGGMGGNAARPCAVLRTRSWDV